MAAKQKNKYKEKISEIMTHKGLRDLWNKHQEENQDELWPKGKLLEYIIVRAFEIESSDNDKVEVTYPFGVTGDGGKEEEQIDGAIHYRDLHALIECKDYKEETIDVVPLAKLHFRLKMRHASVIGLFFSNTEITEVADSMMQFIAPQMILFWGRKDIEYCLDNECFLDCLRTKYRYAIESREYNFKYYQSQENLMQCVKLF